jgi:ABC-type sulfate transport system permease subunit
MNTVNILTTAIDNLWYATYGMIAGWGVTVTLMVIALIILLIRTINLQRRLDHLENRIITSEREFNLFSKTWPGKK